MRSAVLLAIFLIGLIGPPGLTGQSRRAEFLNVTSWRGSFDMSVDRADVTNGVKWSVQGRASGELLYETADLANTPPQWLGKIQNARVDLRADLAYSSADGTCSNTGIFLASGPLLPVSGKETAVRVLFDVWDVRLNRSQTKNGTYTLKRVCPSGTTTTVTEGSNYIPTGVPLQFPYPDQGFVLDGKGKAGRGVGIPDSHIPIPLQALNWDVHFHLEPVVDGLTLEVTSAQYDTWRPTAEPGPQAGKSLEFTATVKRASGQEAQVEVDHFVWELVSTSREPGIALNFPIQADDNDPDLKLDPQTGQLATGPDGQKVERYVPNSVQDRAVVLPYDWGGWSTLQATAYLRDGRKLVGKLQGSTEEGIRLPKRAKDSFIADAWKKDTSGADQDDNEEEPAGEPGCDGDGLTLYEEYRGFYENGKHIEGNPKKKDFFVLNKIGADADGGLEVFGTQTDLEVHKELLGAEFDEHSRIVNANHKQGPHRIDQHGVVLVSSDVVQGGLTSADPAMDGVHWRPGMVTKVEIEDPNGDGASYSTGRQVNPIDAFTLYDKTVAHELLHSVGVEHHGRTDGRTSMRLKITPNPYGRPYFSDDFARILVFDEQTNEDLAVSMEKAAQPLAARMQQVCQETKQEDVEDCVRTAVATFYRPRWILGKKSGQHSGNELCLMRYHFAEVYIVKEVLSIGNADFDVWARVPPGTEPSGLELCDSPAGTGINAPERKPQPRYYDANRDEGRGACKTWVCVNDAIPPRSSYSPK